MGAQRTDKDRKALGDLVTGRQRREKTSLQLQHGTCSKSEINSLNWHIKQHKSFYAFTLHESAVKED